MRLRVSGFLLLLCLLLSGISAVGAQEAPLKVVATYSILGDLVQNVAGDNIELTVLVGPDGDSHTYEPTPQDMVTLSQANIIFENGLEFETWLDELYEASGSTAQRVVVSDGIEPLAFVEGEHAHEHEEEHAGEEADHAHEHGDASDLSVWAGEWVSTSAYDAEAFQPAFDAVVASTPELNADTVHAYFDEGYRTSFDTFLVEGETVTLTSEAGSAACDYAYTGTTPVIQVAGEVWSVFETNDENCTEYRYLLLSPPHAVEAGASLHFHMIYGSALPEEIAESSGIWVPALYPAGTDAAALVNMWVANARLLGVYIAGVNGIEAAMTEEEQSAQASATGGEAHEHEDEHVEITDLIPWDGSWISTRRYSDLPDMQAAYETIAEIVGVSVEEAEAFIHSVEHVDFDDMIVEGSQVIYVDGNTRLTCTYEVVGEDIAMFVGVPFGTWYQWETSDAGCESYRYVLATSIHSGDFGDVPNFHLRYGSVSFEELTELPENATWFATVGPEALTAEVYVNSYTTGAQGWAAFMLAERGDSSMLDAMLAGGEGETHDHEHEEDEHGHEHGEFDPHIWHDPNNALVMVENIRAALVAADAANAAEYEANAAAYSAQLQGLDAYIRQQVATIPEANRLLFTSHDTFGYFGEEYGFAIDSAIESVSTETADPSAGEIAALVTEIQESSVPAIFAENITNPALIEQIAREAGVTVAPTLYTDALGQPGTRGETYLSMMRYNIDTIAAALSGQN